MNSIFRKTLLHAGAYIVLGIGFSPAVNAASSQIAHEVVQQQKDIKGVISDNQGPVIGATIMEKGTNNGTMTDIDGKFSLSVKPGATLVISYIVAP